MKLPLFFLGFVTAIYSKDNYVIVKSPFWEIIGKREKVFDKQVDEFLGIPYALPPVGDERFKMPKYIDDFPSKIEALNIPPSCIQIPMPFDDIVPEDFFYNVLEGQSENCLYLNIWRPSCPEKSLNKPKAVMLWIYGGSFQVGSSGLFFYNGEILSALGDVLLVTINYRLGSFGFLSAGTKEEPGNLGLYDQLTALKWVKNNIQYFGGDPEKITVFGESAGAISAAALVTSPLCKGLFRRAILQSGSTTMPRFITDKKEILNLSNKLAERVNCLGAKGSLADSPDEVLKCLREKDVGALVSAERAVNREKPLSYLCPSYDDSEFMGYKSQYPFRPSAINDVDIMIGITEEEFGDDIQYVFPKLLGPEKPKVTMDDILREFRNLVALREGKYNIEDIISPYLEGIPRDNDTAMEKAISTMLSDYLMACPSFYLVNHPGFKGRKLYFYYYTHYSSPGINTDRNETKRGAFHFDDVPYVFGVPLYPKNLGYTEAEGEFSKNIIDLWTTFAKNGHPESPRHYYWPEYRSSDPKVLELRADGARVLNLPPAERCWNRWREYFDPSDAPQFCYKKDGTSKECDDD